VHEVEELGILLVRDVPLPLLITHSRHGCRLGVRRTMCIQKSEQIVFGMIQGRHYCACTFELLAGQFYAAATP
jgi:hypothetical protein